MEYRKLIVLELLGYEEEEERAPWFFHGKAMEPFARGAYEWKTGQDVTNDVILIHKEYDWLSASPDGVWLPDYDNMLEIKSRKELETYHEKLAEQQRLGNIEAASRPQVQCQMLVSGLTSIDFVNYHQDNEQMIRKLNIFQVERDQAMIDRIEEKAISFMTECYEIAEIKKPVLSRQEAK